MFVSFDFDNDKTLKDFIIGQAKLPDSPFEVVDQSLVEPAPQSDWEERAKERIRRADVFMIMLGPKTAKAPGVLKEVRIASQLNKTRFQIIGYRDGNEQWAVPDGGRCYRWNWDTLKALLA